MPNDNNVSRRWLLQTIMTAVVPIGHGLIRPAVAIPDITVRCENGTTAKLPDLLRDRGSALQLMFTNCETTCPMQGAIFERVQKIVPDLMERGLQLVSLSIDPAEDTTAAMNGWLRRYHSGLAWIGVVPLASELSKVKEFFGQGEKVIDNHSTQVEIVNRKAEVVWRTSDLPSAEEVAGLMKKL